MKRPLNIIFAVNFLMSCVLIGNSWAVQAKNINIPAQCGLIKEVYDTPAGSPQGRPVIICIQDAHCNYEAQKNIAQLLEQLVKGYGLRLIMVEGGRGNVNLSYLRGYSDGKARIEVADKYLRSGRISGEEYLDIVADYDIDLYGIDDEKLYDSNLSAFLRIDSLRRQAVTYLLGLSEIIDRLKPFIYGDGLLAFEGKRKAYQDKQTSLAEYCLYLSDNIKGKKLHLDVYPNLALFLEICRLEKKLDLKKAEAERNDFVRELAGLLDEDGVQGLLDKSRAFKDGKCAPHEYYAFLEARASGKVDIAVKYPELSGYLKYISASRNVDPAQLLSEIKSAEEEIHNSLVSNGDQKRLSDIETADNILIDLWNLELLPENYGYFKSHADKFDISSWEDFLSEQSRKYALPVQPRKGGMVKDNLKQVDEFYQLGIAREDVFMRNIDDQMKDSRDKVSVVIAGGFHTPGLTQRLRDKGYSYVVVAPVVTQKTDSDIYFSVLKSQNKAGKDIR